MEPEDDRQKRIYCAWYNFAQIAMNMDHADLVAMEMDDPESRAALKRARRFYEPWELDKGLDADEWWEGHSQLFEDTYKVRALKPREKPRDPEALIIEVPLRKSPTKLKEIVGELILSAMWDRGLLRTKNLTRSSACYRLTEGKEVKIRAIEALRWFVVAYLQNKHLRGKKQLEEIVRFYKKNRKETGGVPEAFIYEADNEERIKDVLRSKRRNYWKSRMLLGNVIRGDFPGDTY